MSKSGRKFDDAIRSVVSRIAAGHVMSYGEVAHAAGYPRCARMVSKAMRQSPVPLPWYRVVRSDRTLAFEVGSKPYQTQKSLLSKEGVKFCKGKAIPVNSTAGMDLDELLWGLPPDDE